MRGLTSVISISIGTLAAIVCTAEAAKLDRTQIEAIFADQVPASPTTAVFAKYTADLRGPNLPQHVAYRHAFAVLSQAPTGRVTVLDRQIIQNALNRHNNGGSRVHATLQKACARLEKTSNSADDARAVALLLTEADQQAEDDSLESYRTAIRSLSKKGRATLESVLKANSASVISRRIDLVGVAQEIPETLLQQWRAGCERYAEIPEIGIPQSQIRLVPTLGDAP